MATSENSTPTTYLQLNAIDLKQRIGHGNASVFKATMAIAVKKVDCHGNEVPREVEVHSKLPPHPNVLPLLGVSRDGDTLYICMELADKSLYDYLHTEKKMPSFHQRVEWAKQIASGMHHIHQHDLAHRDLKSANVLLFEAEGITKVCDFGSARPLEQTATVTGMMGTCRWMAPEFKNKASTTTNQLCDVFSYGMVLYEIFMQQVPFAGIDDGVAVIKLIQAGERPPLSAELPRYIKMLIQSCWEHRPHIRPRFDKILRILTTAPTSEQIETMLDGETLLHKAAEFGDVPGVQKLVGDHVNVNSWTVDGKTALHLAAENGHVSIVQILIVAHADLNQQDKDGYTALFCAALRGHAQVVQLLLQQKADVNICDMNGFSPLYVASQKGRTGVVECMMKNGADPNQSIMAGPSPLYVASSNGCTDIVDTLLRWKADPNQTITIPPYCVSLGTASENGHAQTVERLLEGGANVNYYDKNGYTALLMSCRRGHTNVIHILLKYGADPNLTPTVDTSEDHVHSPLYTASSMGYTEIVDTLLKKGANPNLACIDGLHPLYVASIDGRTEIVDTLLKGGADPNLATKGIRSVPLGVASQNGHTKTVERLLEGGADVNYQDRNGQTALTFASRHGHMEIVHLLNQAANSMLPTMHTSKLATHSVALLKAAENGHRETVERLLKQGANINHQDESGFTPLFVASHGGHTEVVNTLLNSGADPNLACTVWDGRSPLAVALDVGHSEIVNILLNSGAGLNKD